MLLSRHLTIICVGLVALIALSYAVIAGEAASAFIGGFIWALLTALALAAVDALHAMPADGQKPDYAAVRRRSWALMKCGMLFVLRVLIIPVVCIVAILIAALLLYVLLSRHSLKLWQAQGTVVVTIVGALCCIIKA